MESQFNFVAATDAGDVKAGFGSGQTVLLVEDHTPLRKVLAPVVRSLGYRCVSSCDAVDAERVFETEGSVDLLLTDIILPDGDGITLHRHLHRRDPDLLTLFMSAHPDYAGITFAGPDMQTGFLGKPFGRQQLASALCALRANARRQRPLQT